MPPAEQQEEKSHEIIKQGAEAKLYISQWNGVECLVKERFEKKYRHPDLEKQLTKERMRAETKAMARCLAAGIRVPKVFNMNLDDRRIHMEYFGNSITVKQYINEILSIKLSNDAAVKRLGEQIGLIIGKMHINNIIHGDLTTSNMLLESKPNDTINIGNNQLIFIDFGLSHYSQSTEDKGVDLYVLERALLSTHSRVPNLFDYILLAYQTVGDSPAGALEVVNKFEAVRARGRKRTMIG